MLEEELQVLLAGGRFEEIAPLLDDAELKVLKPTNINNIIFWHATFSLFICLVLTLLLPPGRRRACGRLASQPASAGAPHQR